jgi:hypothetical protein
MSYVAKQQRRGAVSALKTPVNPPARPKLVPLYPDDAGSEKPAQPPKTPKK